MGASTSVAQSTIDNKSIANIIIGAVTTNSSTAAAATSTNQTIDIDLSYSKGTTINQTADITTQLKAVIQNSTDSQLQSAATTALTALAKQQATSSSSVGINTSVTISKETQTAITNVSQQITVNNISKCSSTVSAEQKIRALAVGAEGATINQTISISQMADCLLGSTSVNSAISALTTQLAATTTQSASASLIDSNGIIAAVIICLVLSCSSSVAAYFYNQGPPSGGKSDFRSVRNSKFVPPRRYAMSQRWTPPRLRYGGPYSRF